jgi:cytoskeletal protein RodZ
MSLLTEMSGWSTGATRRRRPDGLVVLASALTAYVVLAVAATLAAPGGVQHAGAAPPAEARQASGALTPHLRLAPVPIPSLRRSRDEHPRTTTPAAPAVAATPVAVAPPAVDTVRPAPTPAATVAVTGAAPAISAPAPSTSAPPASPAPTAIAPPTPTPVPTPTPAPTFDSSGGFDSSR